MRAGRLSPTMEVLQASSPTSNLPTAMRIPAARLFLLWFFALPLLVVALEASALAEERPNFVIVMVDDMGYEGVSCFGNPYFQTPEIDRLASEGMRLTDFHSSGTVCSPTRAGLLTGRYQQRAGIEAVIHPSRSHPEHRKGLQPEETTFAEVLSQAGYTTGLIGKWHQGYPVNSENYHPDLHGFDEFVGYHSGNIDFVSHVGDHGVHDWWYGRQETYEEGYSTHLINDMTTDFIRRHAESDAPFCLYVAHEAIHNPVQVPGDPVRRTEQGWDRWKWRQVSKEERIEKYKGMTLPIDEGIGDLRRTLVELGIDRNTFVLFFSDNGPSGDFPSGSPKLRGGKGSVYEGGHKVPAIAWWPEHIAASTSDNQPMISLDVMPTILSLAGIERVDEAKELKQAAENENAQKEEGAGETTSVAQSEMLPLEIAFPKLDGVDLSPVFTAGAELPDRPLFWASLSNSGSRSEAMRERNWKLVVQHPKAEPGTFQNERYQLFDLSKDPAEKTDVSAKFPERAKAMLTQLKDWYADTQASMTPQVGGWLGRQVSGASAATESTTPSSGDELVTSVTKTVLRKNRNGKSATWFHPRACRVPLSAVLNQEGHARKNEQDQASHAIFMNLQEISGSDYFGPVHWTVSKDEGQTWSDFEAVPPLGRIPVEGHEGLEAGVCDVTPQYHPQTNTILALGHVVFYRGPKFSNNDQLSRYPVYAVRRADGTWSERKILQWDDPRGSFIYSNNCGQRLVLPSGDVLMAFTFGAESKARSVCGVLCSFDGEDLRIKQVGPALTNEVGRGLLEPSLATFDGSYYLTIRAEDGFGYVAASKDGLDYEMKPWRWDDGEEIPMSTTQQHWLTHSDGLYLVYTRKDPINEGVMRWRSPLWMAKFDPEQMCLLRKTERIVLPLVGNGVRHADSVALMGNFDVTNVSPQESWVTVGEWLPRRGARGDLLLSRIRWSQPNALVAP